MYEVTYYYEDQEGQLYSAIEVTQYKSIGGNSNIIKNKLKKRKQIFLNISNVKKVVKK